MGRLQLTQGEFDETLPYILRGLEKGKRKQENEKIFGNSFSTADHGSGPPDASIPTTADAILPKASRSMKVPSAGVGRFSLPRQPGVLGFGFL